MYISEFWCGVGATVIAFVVTSVIYTWFHR